MDVIDGWYLAAPLGALALVGVLACALVLLAVWFARPERPTKAPYEPKATDWPAGPRAAWDESEVAVRLPRLGSPPRWATFEEYRGQIESPQRVAGVLGACGIAIGAGLAAALWFVPPVPSGAWQEVLVAALPVLAGAQIVLGVCAWWPPRRRALLRAQHERAERFGVMCEVHPSAFEIWRRDEGRTSARLLIAVGTPDRQAARISAALERWVARLEEIARPDRPDAAAIDYELEDAWGLRAAVRTEDLFGSGAEGGYLVATAHQPGGWAILIEMGAVNGDTTRFRWVEKVFFRLPADQMRSASQQPPR